MPGLWTSGGCKPVVELQHMISPIQNRYCRALLIAAAVMLTACTTAAQDAKKPKWTDPSGFEVIGIEARTNNSQESTGSGAIPRQWQRLFMENLQGRIRSEEHTSELQSLRHLVCRLLLEKKNK